MNAATVVTSVRIALSPVFFFLFTISAKEGKAPLAALVALWAIFAVMETTDFVDGLVARKTGSVTDLGKVFDPFADSFARLTYFLSFLVAGFMPSWAFLLVLYRDLGVSFVRLMAMSKGVAMAAQLSGKIKAGVYATAGGAGLALLTLRSAAGAAWAAAALPAVEVLAQAAWWASAATAVWTMIDYAAAYRRLAAKSGG